MKTFKIAIHKQSGKKFVRNSYTSHKAFKWTNLSFSEKLEIGLQTFSEFDTKNDVHVKQLHGFKALVKHIKSLKSAERQNVKIQLNVLLESAYGDYIDFHSIEPRKLAKLVFDLGLNPKAFEVKEKKVLATITA
jgi:hypothetical protein